MRGPGPSRKTPSSGAYATVWHEITSFVFDLRFIQVLGQIAVVIVLVTLVSRVVTDMLLALNQQGLTPNFDFFLNRSGFDVAEAPSWYSANSSYWEAFQVGLVNTLRVVIAGLIATTVLGVLVGIFLLSSNWLVRTISKVYVEILRNTPLLVQLFVWYFIVILSLPVLNDAVTLPQEGVLLLPIRLALYALVLILALRQFRQGDPRRLPVLIGLLAAVAAIEIGLSGAQLLPARGAIDSPAFLVYLAASLLLLGAAWFLPAVIWQSRHGEALPNGNGEPPLLGVGYSRVRDPLAAFLAGQLAGGLIAYFGLAPVTALRVEVYPLVYLSNRGIFLPEIMLTARFNEWAAFAGLGLLAAGVIWAYYGRVMETTGRAVPRLRYAALAVLACAALGWLLVAMEPGPEIITVEQDGAAVVMSLDEARAQGLVSLQDELLVSRSPLIVARPERKGLRFAVGIEITPEFMSLFLGLTIYTSTFIAEIVRAGILAVPHGQIEAARALGLSQSQTLRMVILPQALRVIIPPLGNQYLNLAKNSSLAIAIGFADFYQVATTVMNQSGQSVTGISVVMLAYLAISLAIAGGTNWVNRRFQLVTR